MVICSEPVSEQWSVLVRLYFASPWHRLTACASALSARGRDEEEEGGAHRPGDYELGESVSGLIMN